MCLIFVADIGATNSRFALFQCRPDTAEQPLLSLQWEQWLQGADFPSFAEALTFLMHNAPEGSGGPSLAAHMEKEHPVAAVIAPAGPIQGDTCRISNLPWVIRKQEVREQLGLDHVYLINDFVAQAYACLLPEEMNLHPVLRGDGKPGLPVAVAGAGTGFGKALLVDAPLPGPPASPATQRERARKLGGVRVLPSEGGHVLFPFVGPDEWDFARFATERLGGRAPIGDTVVSGTGLRLLFAYHTGTDMPAHEVTAHMDAHPEVLRWFARFYARICKNFVLDTLALGGLYITGGMALRIPVLDHPAFAEEFYASDAQQALLKQVPVWHMRNPQAGLWGAALYGLMQIYDTGNTF